jgi:hypothetical protein
MADARAAWNETGDKLTELGRKLKVHYESQHGGESQQSREELADAARRVGSAVQDAFEALGAAARDKTVQDDVKKVGQSLAEALGATLGTAAGELRRVLAERKGPGGAAATGTATEPGATTGGTTEADDALVAEPPAPPAGGEGTAASEDTEGAGTTEGSTDAPGEQPPKVEPWGTP